MLQIKNDGTLLSALTSKSVIVQICSIPVVIEEQPQPILEVKDGSGFTLCCKASGYPEPYYQWFHNNTKLEGQTSNTLHVRKLSYFHFMVALTASFILPVLSDKKIQLETRRKILLLYL